MLFELLRKRPLKLRNLLILDLQLALECVALGPALLQLASQRACLASLTFQLGLGRSELGTQGLILGRRRGCRRKLLCFIAPASSRR